MLRDVDASRLHDLGAALPQCRTAEHPDEMAPQGRGREVGFGDLRKGSGAGAGVPPFNYVFPAFTARSSRVQYNGKSGRSCSPS